MLRSVDANMDPMAMSKVMEVRHEEQVALQVQSPEGGKGFALDTTIYIHTRFNGLARERACTLARKCQI